MNREEALKTRNQLEAQIKENTHKSLACLTDLSEITKSLSGIDAKITTLEQKKSDIPITQRHERVQLYKLGIVLISFGLIVAMLFYFTNSNEEYIVLITAAIIALVCCGLLCGYLLWSNLQTLRQDQELNNEIANIKNSTNELIKKRSELQDQLEAITVDTLNIIHTLKTLTDVK